jgi:predicted DNA-binding transcriptional regulator YafY
MSHRAITRRQHYIDSRLRYRQDYPSGPDIVRGLREEYGESVSKRTIERDMGEMRDRGAPIEYDPRRHGYYYSDLSWQLPALDLTEGDLMALMVSDRAREWFSGAAARYE